MLSLNMLTKESDMFVAAYWWRVRPGKEAGARIARKHISWYTKGLAGSAAFRRQMNMLLTAEAQLAAINEFFDRLGERDTRLYYVEGDGDTESNEEQALAA